MIDTLNYYDTCKKIILPECFWGLEDTYEECDCSKVFFDVFVNLYNVRILICKDWYTNKIKLLLHGEFQAAKIHSHSNYCLDIKDAQSLMLKYIMDKYFKENIIKKMIFSESTAYQTRRKQFELYTNLLICNRPYMFCKISLLKFFEWYHFEFIQDRFQYNRDIFPHALGLYRACISDLEEKLKDTTAIKYHKIRAIVKGFKSDSNPEKVVETSIQLYDELIKL